MASRRDGEGEDDEKGGNGERESHAGCNSFMACRHRIGCRRSEGEYSAHHGWAVISPRLGDKLSRRISRLLIRSTQCHHSRVVGRLEQCIAGGDDDQRSDVAQTT